MAGAWARDAPKRGRGAAAGGDPLRGGWRWGDKKGGGVDGAVRGGGGKVGVGILFSARGEKSGRCGNRGMRNGTKK